MFMKLRRTGKTERHNAKFEIFKTEAALQRCSETKQQIYGRTPMPKYDFNRVVKQLY